MKNKTLILINILLIIVIFEKINDYITIIFKVLFPFLLGFLIAFIFEGLIEYLEKKKINRWISVFLIVAIILFNFFIISKNIAITLISDLLNITDNINFYLNKLNSLVKTFKINRLFDENFEKIIVLVISKIVSFIESFIRFMPVIALTPIISVYFMLDFKNIKKFIKNLRIYQKNILFFTNIKIKFRAYIKATLLITFIVFCLSNFLFWYFDLPSPILLSFIVGITDLIPFIGPIIGGIIVVIICLFNSIIDGIISLALVIIIQILENNVIMPKIQANSIKIHPILIIFSIILFSELFGFIGFFLAIPCVIFSEFLYKKSNNFSCENNVKL